jgi:hypothetical protein
MGSFDVWHPAQPTTGYSVQQGPLMPAGSLPGSSQLATGTVPTPWTWAGGQVGGAQVPLTPASAPAGPTPSFGSGPDVGGYRQLLTSNAQSVGPSTIQPADQQQQILSRLQNLFTSGFRGNPWHAMGQVAQQVYSGQTPDQQQQILSRLQNLFTSGFRGNPWHAMGQVAQQVYGGQIPSQNPWHLAAQPANAPGSTLGSFMGLSPQNLSAIGAGANQSAGFFGNLTSGQMMQAPDGTIQSVPSEHVDHYTSLGAKPWNASSYGE